MSRAHRRALGRVLAAAVSGEPMDVTVRSMLARPGEAGTRALLVAASRHGVTGPLAQALLPLPDLDATLRQQLAQARARVLRDHLRALSELAVLAPALDDLETRWLLFKGPALARAAYPPPHLREYVDLDVLVPGEAVGVALQRLLDVGCRVVDRDWADLERERAGEVKLMSPGGVLIDLHWELLNDWRVREAFRVPPTRELVRRARTVDLDGLHVPTLHPVDTVLHAALHAGTSGGWRLLWLKDVSQTLLALDGATQDLSVEARRWQVELLLAVMAQRADRVLGTGSAPLARSGPGSSGWWLRLVDVVDALAPVERATGAGSLTRIVTNSTRRTTMHSGAELLQRCALFLVNAGLRRDRRDAAPSTADR